MKTTSTFQNHSLYRIFIKRNPLFFLGIFILLLSSCTTDDSNLTPPTVTTMSPIVSSGIVTLGGDVISNGGSAVTERGICIGENANPIITNPDNLIEPIGNGFGAFSENFDISTAPSNITFHYRAYAINSYGTAYGEDKTFSTSSACPVIIAPISISSPTTWTVGNVYVINTTLTINSTLTIEPGVIVKLTINGNINVESGTIIANGNANNRIVFTSIADDSYCGDTNGDGNLTTPQKGDWLNLYLNGGTNNSFKFCDFLYAGANDSGYRCAVVVSVSGTSFTFDNCTFAHTQTATNFTAQFAFYASSYMSNPLVSVFTNNVFYDNNIPIYLSATYSINANNSYSNPTNPSEKNIKNCIWMYPEAGSNVAVVLNETEVPYVMDGYLQKTTGTFTINAGVIMKFPIGNTFGLNVANLTLNQTAFLTSIKDDAHGGDTNGDNNATSPSNGDWYGYYNWTSSVWVNGSNILYAAN